MVHAGIIVLIALARSPPWHASAYDARFDIYDDYCNRIAPFIIDGRNILCLTICKIDYTTEHDDVDIDGPAEQVIEGQ